MSRSGRLLLGVATGLPLLVAWCFFVIMLIYAPLIQAQPPFEGPSDALIERLLLLSAIVVVCTVVWTLGLLAYYLVHLYRNPRLTPDQKAFWVAGLLMGHGLVMPVYWYLHVWRG